MTLRQARPAPARTTPLADISISRGFAIGTAVVGALAACALANDLLARKAERDNPPLGRFLHVDGVRLHVLERGQGAPLVLIHGNGSMIEDFVTSGLVNEAVARSHRVIAFDRPGFGHSDRPRTTIWGPDAQADLIGTALTQLGVTGATVLGHSWGCSVAVALARRRPDLVGGLVLASGYYYPTVRTDVVGASIPAVPVLGDMLRYTVTPLLSRLLWPHVVRKMFGPAVVPAKFDGFPKEMSFRPSQIRASAAEAALMIPSAAGAASYAEMTMPVAILAGAEDRLIDVDAQSARLHGDLPHSTFDRVAGAGHMVHQTATEVVLAAIGRVAMMEETRPAIVPLAA